MFPRMLMNEVAWLKTGDAASRASRRGSGVPDQTRAANPACRAEETEDPLSVYPRRTEHQGAATSNELVAALHSVQPTTREQPAAAGGSSPRHETHPTAASPR